MELHKRRPKRKNDDFELDYKEELNNTDNLYKIGHSYAQKQMKQVRNEIALSFVRGCKIAMEQKDEELAHFIAGVEYIAKERGVK